MHRQYLDDERKPSRLLLAVLVDVAGSQEPRAQHGVEQHVQRQQGHVGRHGAHAEEVKQEVACVLSADAVVHPDAVMVKAMNASVADACAADGEVRKPNVRHRTRREQKDSPQCLERAGLMSWQVGQETPGWNSLLSYG